MADPGVHLQVSVGAVAAAFFTGAAILADHLASLATQRTSASVAGFRATETSATLTLARAGRALLVSRMDASSDDRQPAAARMATATTRGVSQRCVRPAGFPIGLERAVSAR